MRGEIIKKKQKLQLAFQSILRSDYISINDEKQLEQLEEYYVDTFNNLPIILQDQDNFIKGRRGTGKTTLLMRSFYECLKTVSSKVSGKSEYFGERKILPIYVDLSQCKDMFEENNEMFERVFISKIVAELKNQLGIIFGEKKFKLLHNDYSKLDDFEFIQHVITHGIERKVSSSEEKEETKNGFKDSYSAEVSPTKPSVSGHESSESEIIITKSVQKVYSVSTQEFLSKLGNIRVQSKLDAIYIFIDEFSDLSEEEQERFSLLLKKLVGSKNNIFFKVGTITGRYKFSDNIIIGRDIFPISLDLNDFVDQYDGIVSCIKVLEGFTEKLIENRLKTFQTNLIIDDVFPKGKSEIISRITREAMGVPRTIGLILQKALQQSAEGKILLSDINIGLKSTRKVYMQQFQGAVKKKIIPGYYMDMWNDIFKKALHEKSKNPKRPASHFMVDPVRSKYLDILCENFIVHLLEEARTSKYGGKFHLYSIDFDICRENDIVFAEEKDQFTAARFIYDTELSKYDCYFLEEAIKSYRCPDCKIMYKEEEVPAKVKRCLECDKKLQEIIHQETPMSEGNFT